MEPSKTAQPISKSMITTDITARVKRIIARQLVIDDALINLDATWEDLDADVIDRAKVMTALEEEFGTEISLEEAEQFETVGEVIQALEEHEV